MDKKPLILISNDDSVNAPGLFRLVDCVPEGAEVIVAAPALPQSGKSCALTVIEPLRINLCKEYKGHSIYAINGSPVDCVKLAMTAIVPRTPDLVLAGINHGSNAGCNVTYSGTMGAVLEGCARNITSCGFSLLDHSLSADFEPSMPFISEMIAHLLDNPLPIGTCLNVNIPARLTPLGTRVCRAAPGHWSDEYVRYLDPMGNPFYQLSGHFVNDAPDAEDTDEYWLAKGYISVVPVALDRTDYASYDSLTSEYNK